MVCNAEYLKVSSRKEICKQDGVTCDRRMKAKTKGKVYKTVVRPAMLYGPETVAMT